MNYPENINPVITIFECFNPDLWNLSICIMNIINDVAHDYILSPLHINLTNTLHVHICMGYHSY